MSKTEIASLAFNLMGIYALLMAVESLSPFFSYLGALFYNLLHGDNQTPLNNFALFPPMLLPILFLLFVGRLLWQQSDRLGKIVFRSDATAPQVIPIASLDALAIALALAGFIMVIHAIPSMGEIVVKWWNLNEANRQGAREGIYQPGADPLHFAQVSAGLKWSIVGMILRLVIGSTVFLKARAISLWWNNHTKTGCPATSTD